MNGRGQVVGGRWQATATLLALLLGANLSAQQTRPERTGFTETSSHADVVAFLDSLERAAPGKFVRGTLGTSTQGRPIPYVIVSRPLVRTADEARASGKPIVYLQGNIHGGEVEGKESLQAILRDLVMDARANVLDSLVLIIQPIYNGDGNDALGAQERNRGSQNGPAQIGLRPNGQQLDLNRDYIKNESPEAQGSLRMMVLWNPDVFVDLHTTNGSYHGYALTYAPSLHPAAMDSRLAPAGPWTRDTLLPTLRQRLRARHRIETFDYGNFRGAFDGRDDPTSLSKAAWESYEHKPRFGTNYHGLHNRVAVLSEAYSHDPFERRIASTTAFVRELLSIVAEQRSTVLARTRRTTFAAAGASIPVRAELTRSPFRAPVLVEALEATGDSVRYEAGLRPGLRRTHRAVPVEMPVHDRFDATRTRTLPTAWVIDASAADVVAKLAFHGIELTEYVTPVTVEAEEFIVDSIIRAPRPFQGHNEVRLEGRWVRKQITLGRGMTVVRAEARHGLIAAILLEAESDDGLTTWNFFDSLLTVGAPHPVRRIISPLPAR
jgi:hypothetical protein